MIIVSLMFLAFIGINIISDSVKTKNIDEYIKDVEKELPEEFKIIK